MIRFYLLLLVITLLPMSLSAQDDVEYKMEIGGGLGGSFYIGDLNSTFYKNTGFAGGLLARYLLNPRMAFKTKLSYNSIKGNTTDVTQFYPDDPNSGNNSPEPLRYSFSSNVIDFSVMYEYNFLPYGRGNSYLGYSRLAPFVQLGIGLSYGQEASAITVNLPIGFGAKYKLSSRLNLALDWTMHFTLSDKLDGLEAPHGIKGSGFKNKDNYSETLITLTYDIFPKCINCNKD
ncbi:MAG: DUF6089 family protein [Bacteroidaceae bacterium]